MNQERPDELRAKEIIERTMGVRLEHADRNGGVDYRSPDGSLAVEVTRVTREGPRLGRDAAYRSRSTEQVPDTLQSCWTAIVPEDHLRMKGRRARLAALFTQLELAGVTTFYDQRDIAAALRGSLHAEIFRALAREGVQIAKAVGDGAHDDGGPHRVVLSLGGGGMARDSDWAVARISKELSERPDNFKKLEESGSEQRHLFVWLDDDTAFEAARPLSRPADENDLYDFGLPTRPPQLDPVVTHLWIVHDRSGRGWLRDGNGWHSIE